MGSHFDDERIGRLDQGKELRQIAETLEDRRQSIDELIGRRDELVLELAGRDLSYAAIGRAAGITRALVSRIVGRAREATEEER